MIETIPTFFSSFTTLMLVLVGVYAIMMYVVQTGDNILKYGNMDFQVEKINVFLSLIQIFTIILLAGQFSALHSLIASSPYEEELKIISAVRSDMSIFNIFNSSDPFDLFLRSSILFELIGFASYFSGFIAGKAAGRAFTLPESRKAVAKRMDLIILGILQYYMISRLDALCKCLGVSTSIFYLFHIYFVLRFGFMFLIHWRTLRVA